MEILSVETRYLGEPKQELLSNQALWNQKN